MRSVFRAIWDHALRPLTSRPPALQVAALCHRKGKNGTEVLLVSSSSGRWILPKGWPIDGLTAAESAQQEAWEEGGVEKARADEAGAETIQSEKRFEDGLTIPCEVKVFPVKVKKVARDFPEKHRRKRLWVAPERAAEIVDEPALSDALRRFAG